MESKTYRARTEDLATREPFSSLFEADEATMVAIKTHMESGYDIGQPIVVWKENKKRQLTVIDGHCRLSVARDLGVFPKIPVVEKRFEDEAEALKYAIHNQRDRRNITDADLHRCIEAVDSRRQRGGDRKSEEAKKSKGSGGLFDLSSAKQTAKATGTSESKVKKSRTVTDHADEKTKKELEEGKKSLNQAAKETKEKRKALPTVKEEAGKKYPVSEEPKLSEEDQKREVDFWTGMEKEIGTARDNFLDKFQGMAEDIAAPLQAMVDEHVKDHSLPDLENLADEVVVAVCSGVRLSEDSLEESGGVSVRFGLGKAEVFTGKLDFKKGNKKRFEAIEKRYNAIRSASLFNVPVKKVEQWGSETVLVIGKGGKTTYEEVKP